MMNLLCPNCKGKIDLQTLSCPQNHQFKNDSGVLLLVEEKFAVKLNVYLKRFSEIRHAKLDNYLKPEDYPLLPFGKAVSGNNEWKLRQYDLEIVMSLLKEREGKQVLEIGPYNGWLTQHIAKLNFDIIAIDYFIDDLDGLKTKNYYGGKWDSIQMDIRDLSIIDEQVDIIVINRCLQFFENPVKYFCSLKEKLKRDGMIILTGLHFFKNPKQKQKQIDKVKFDYKHKFNFELMLVPFKGYLDFEDKRELKSHGVEFFPYSKLFIANIKSAIVPILPRHYYGIFQ